MGIGIFYVISIVPAAVGGAMMIFNRKIVWWEWLIGIAAGLLCSGIMHIIAVSGMTKDTETWSGHVNQVVYHPRWVEKYQQMHTRQVYAGTDAKGNSRYRTEIYYTTEYRTHPEHWVAETTLGRKDINQAFYKQICEKFGNEIRVIDGGKSGFHSGDRNVYPCDNKTGWVQPVTALKSWTNRVKASPSVFSFAKVPENSKVFEWPDNDDPFRSGRLLGITGDIDILSFDQMNSRLGHSKHVNVILIGFGVSEASIAEWQRAAWIGGKKNDLVICFGGDPKKPSWVKTFGWTESDVCKYSVSELILGEGATNEVLPKLEAVIKRDFKAKDWSKFDYLSIEPRAVHYISLAVGMLFTQALFWWWASNNEFSKNKAAFG